MTMLDSRMETSPELANVITTNAAIPSSLANASKELEVQCQSWDNAIRELWSWAKDPQSVADEDLEPPQLLAIRHAMELAHEWKTHAAPAPLRVVPNGDGGVVFEWHDKDMFFSLEIQHDGAAELNVFEQCKLIETIPWTIAG